MTAMQLFHLVSNPEWPDYPSLLVGRVDRVAREQGAHGLEWRGAAVLAHVGRAVDAEGGLADQRDEALVRAVDEEGEREARVVVVLLQHGVELEPALGVGEQELLLAHGVQAQLVLGLALHRVHDRSLQLLSCLRRATCLERRVGEHLERMRL